MSVTAIRESILDFFISSGNNVDVIEYNKDASEAYPEKLEVKYGLGYLPEGYKLGDTTSDDTMYEEYYAMGGNYIDFQQFTKGAYASASDSEFSAARKYSYNGNDYIIRESDDMTMLVWEKDGYVFELTGFESRSEMLKSAESVKQLKGGE